MEACSWNTGGEDSRDTKARAGTGPCMCGRRGGDVCKQSLTYALVNNLMGEEEGREGGQKTNFKKLRCWQAAFLLKGLGENLSLLTQLPGASGFAGVPWRYYIAICFSVS